MQRVNNFKRQNYFYCKAFKETYILKKKHKKHKVDFFTKHLKNIFNITTNYLTVNTPLY